MHLTEVLGSEERYDAVLVGAGIMSSTLAVLLHELDPELRLLIIERLDSPGLESSHPLNNAGTGHAANCELNYTPIGKNGLINTEKAFVINAAFEQSLELWSSLTESGKLAPSNFLNVVPHISIVFGDDDVEFLKYRYKSLSSEYAFSSMEWSSDFSELHSWMPLVLEGRDRSQKLAATRVKRGTDINFGALTSSYLDILQGSDSIEVKFSTELIDLQSDSQGGWYLELQTKERKQLIYSSFVFLGAGGGALTLLQKSGISQSLSYGGFPVSGQWLVCKEPKVTSRHKAKVYGLASVGAPPMSVPHLDTLWIEGDRSLLFGPFAGFSTKFLKYGSIWDLFGSIKSTNLKSILQAGIENIDLARYLISQLQLNHEDRMESLKTFLPTCKNKDWDLSIAGQRVQIIKKTKKGGVLKMGTEVVCSADGSLAALLGASPGASTSVSIMLEVLQKCWVEKMSTKAWKIRMKNLLPTFGKNLHEDASLFMAVRDRNDSILGLGPEK